MKLSPKLLKIARYLTTISVIISAYFSLKAMFLDMDLPGTEEARQISSWVYYLFIFTVVCALPLLYEKYLKLNAWDNRFEIADETEKKTMIWGVVKPIIRTIIIVLAMTIISVIIIQIIHPISPEQIANYQAYYSQPKPISYP